MEKKVKRLLFYQLLIIFLIQPVGLLGFQLFKLGSAYTQITKVISKDDFFKKEFGTINFGLIFGLGYSPPSYYSDYQSYYQLKILLKGTKKFQTMSIEITEKDGDFVIAEF